MMTLIRLLLRTSRHTAILSILTGCLCGASTALLVALINTALESSTPRSTAFVFTFVGLLIALIGLTIVSQILLVRLAEESIYTLRMHLSRRILAAPLRHLEDLGSHRLLAVLTKDIGDISEGYQSLPTIFIQGTALVVGLIYLGVLSWVLLLTAVIFLVGGAFSYLALAKRAQHAFRLARETQDTLLHLFRGVTEGTKELKIHHRRRQVFLDDLLESTAQASRGHTVTGMSIYAVARGWGNSLFFVLIGLLLFGVPSWQSVTSGDLRGAAMIILYMISPLAIVLNMLPTLGRAAVALQKLEALGIELDSSAKEEQQEASATPPAWKILQLDQIVHTYRHEQDDSQFTLGPLDLNFRPGETVFLVGGNGSGKTTLAKLLLGLYTPEAGTIRIDGQPVTPEHYEDYRQLFSAVFSDFYLFEKLPGLNTPTLDADGRAYLTKLHLDQKVHLNNGQLSTTALSQGQRKRLALLAAYLEDRPFYVFDEWAADQDPLFKEVFYTQLIPELKQRGKTVLAITHDDRYYHLADRVIKLNYGQIVE